jgi:hypothetical protein
MIGNQYYGLNFAHFFQAFVESLRLWLLFGWGGDGGWEGGETLHARMEGFQKKRKIEIVQIIANRVNKRCEFCPKGVNSAWKGEQVFFENLPCIAVPPSTEYSKNLQLEG